MWLVIDNELVTIKKSGVEAFLIGLHIAFELRIQGQPSHHYQESSTSESKILTSANISSISGRPGRFDCRMADTPGLCPYDECIHFCESVALV